MVPNGELDRYRKGLLCTVSTVSPSVVSALSGLSPVMSKEAFAIALMTAPVPVYHSLRAHQSFVVTPRYRAPAKFLSLAPDLLTYLIFLYDTGKLPA